MENVLELWDTDSGKEFKNEAYKSVCALLNSNGGKLILHTKMKADKIIRAIEQNCQKFLPTSDVTKKITTPGQTPNQDQITLEVKGNDVLCTMSYNLYSPSITQAMLVDPREFAVVKEILNIDKMVDITETHKNVPTEFKLNDPIGIKESKTVQFKCLKSEKTGSTDLASRIDKNKLTRYVSAFANHCGGRIYYGVEDDETVKGQIVEDEDKKELTMKISEYINKMIWPEYCGKPPQRGTDGHWDIFFEPVKDENGNPIQSTFVIVIFIAACPGGVFTKEPESYHIVDGKVEKMKFAEWKRKFLNPAWGLEAKIAPRVSQCDWSSPNLRRICDSLDGKLLRMINNGEWDKFDQLVTKLQKDIGDQDEKHLVLLSKRFMLHYRKSQYEEAKGCLAEFNNRLSKANDILIFDVRGRLVLSAMERSRGDHKTSYEIARDCLSKVEQIAPSILSVEFYVHLGTMLTIMESKKELNNLSEGLEPGSFKDEAISYFDKALQHSEEADYVPQSKVDMQQKILIHLAFLHLGCSLSGDVVDHSVSEEDIKKAKACLKKAKDSVLDSNPMSRFRNCHLRIAESCWFYRISRLKPSAEERNNLLDSAIREVEDVEYLAERHNFDEISRYAKNHAEVFKRGKLLID